MEYKGYLGQVEYDDDAGIFHGEVMNLRDVITFQGETWTTTPRVPRIGGRLSGVLR